MKILLINPSYTTSTLGLGQFYGEPLGLAYVAAAIEKNGRHEVKILDSIGMAKPPPRSVEPCLVGLAEEEVFRILATQTFDVLGVTTVQENPQEMLDFIAKLKSAYNHTPVVIGGPSATLKWRTFLEDGHVDAIVAGEGEETVIELLDAMEEGRSLESVRGIAFRDADGSPRLALPREPMNVDEIPWPARHLLPMENHTRSRHRFVAVASILTSRACPYVCSFCNIRNIWSTKWRGRDPLDVVDEMQHLVDTYGVRRIFIEDDNFIVNRRRVEAICDEIIRRKLSINWLVEPGLAIWLVNKPLLKKMRDSGMIGITAQIETGSQKTMEYIKKNIDFDRAREMLKYAGRLGLGTAGNIIIGFPHEARNDIEESIRVAESLHIDRIDYLFPIPYENTPMYDDYVREGLIQEGEEVRVPVATRHLSAKELARLRDEAAQKHRRRRFLQLLAPQALFLELLPKLFYKSRRLLADLVVSRSLRKKASSRRSMVNRTRLPPSRLVGADAQVGVAQQQSS